MFRTESEENQLTFARIAELQRDPVQGRFDVAHLQEVHRRIFQDVTEHRPGEFRPDAPMHYKNRPLISTRDTMLVHYALRPEIDAKLGRTLDALKGGEALKGYDLLEMSEAISQTYSRLDYLHPFREGNSRTLRTFTQQLARENGYELDWGTNNVTLKSRDALYIARDMAVIQHRNPGISMGDAMAATTREDYEIKYRLATQVERYRNADPLQEIVRRSLEQGRDQAPYARRMSIKDVVREIAAVEPIARAQADRNVEETKLAVTRKTAPPSDYDRAANMRDWVARDGAMTALTDRLENVASGHVTIRHEPGAPALDRLTAIADGINLELAKQRTIASPTIAQPTITLPARDLGQDLER